MMKKFLESILRRNDIILYHWKWQNKQIIKKFSDRFFFFLILQVQLRNVLYCQQEISVYCIICKYIILSFYLNKYFLFFFLNNHFMYIKFYFCIYINKRFIWCKSWFVQNILISLILASPKNLICVWN